MKPMVVDKVIRDSVLDELESDPEVIAKHISVTAIDGAVTLRGHVMTIHEKHVAVRAAERVGAVRAIADEIEVREPSLHERADDEIAEEVAHLRTAGGPIADSVAVQIRNGRVILHGEVESIAERDTAVEATRRLTGVRVVDDLIKVKSLPTATEVERRVRAAVTRVAERDGAELEVSLEGSKVRLRGRLASLTALASALHAAESVPGVAIVDSEVVVSLEKRPAR